jgi:G:T-mismatch repair DNA endonuclease (very short patch repair protein)
MSDNLTIKQRSKCMSNIRSKWTDQEKKIHSYLKANKIKHKMHPTLLGSPDVLSQL